MARYKLTEEQKQEIIKSDLNYCELAKIYNVHNTTISRIKRNAGIFEGRGCNLKGNVSKLSKDIRNELLDLKNEVMELAIKYSISTSYIYQLRRKKNPKKKTPELKNSEKPKEHREKIKLQASMTAAEQAYLLLKAAKEEAKKNTDAYKIASGSHGWRSRKDQYGKVSWVLTKL